MALLFMSLRVTEDRKVICRRGWVFRVQGELCHLIGSLCPEDGRPPSYMQLYIFDTRLALAQRMNRNDNLCSHTMETLQTMLLNSHPYTNQFKHAFELLEQYPDEADASVRLQVMPGHNQRCYNLPTSDEIVVILLGDGTAPDRWDIILRHRSDNQSLTWIDNSHPAYSPLHYVLLFPNGDLGWHRDLHHRPVPGSVLKPGWNAPHISQTQYSLFHLHTCTNEYSTIHRSGRLFQQYIVDIWASVDQTRLAFLRFNQGRLHATL